MANHRSTDPMVSFKVDRVVPLWGIISVIGAIAGAAVTGYIQIDRLNASTASLTKQVEAMNLSQSAKRESDMQMQFEVMQLKETIKRHETALGIIQQQVMAYQSGKATK